MPKPFQLLLLASGTLGHRCGALLGLESTLANVVRKVPLDTPPSIADFDLVAIVSDRPFPALAREVDHLCWAAGTRWTAAWLRAHEFVIGPTVVPPFTACYGCWERRRRSMVADLHAHDAVEEFALHSVSATWFRGRLQSLSEQVAALAAAEILDLSRVDPDALPRRQGRYIEGDAVYGATRTRNFDSIGLCPRCGEAGAQERHWKPLANALGGGPVPAG